MIEDISYLRIVLVVIGCIIASIFLINLGLKDDRSKVSSKVKKEIGEIDEEITKKEESISKLKDRLNQLNDGKENNV